MQTSHEANAEEEPKVGDNVIAVRTGNKFMKGEVGILKQIDWIDSERYYFITMSFGVMIGPSLDSYWKKNDE